MCHTETFLLPAVNALFSAVREQPGSASHSAVIKGGG